MVVKADTVTDDAAGVLQRFKAVTMNALLFQRPDDALDQAVLLRRVGRDELLAQSVAFHQRRIAAVGEDQAVIPTQPEGFGHPSQRAKARDQGVLQRRFRRFRLAAA